MKKSKKCTHAQEHETLLNMTFEIEQLLCKDLSVQDIAAIKNAFSSLNATLRKHFQIEERDILSDILLLCPQKEKEVEGICKEHKKLQKDMQLLCQSVDEIRDHLKQFKTLFCQFNDTLKQHEAKETHLIQDVYINNFENKY